MAYGFVGLGNLGGFLAESLLREGFQLTVHDLDKDLAKTHLEAGAIWADSAAEVASRCDAVFTCLPSPAVSEAVLDQMLEVMPEGATWIECSTIGRDDMLKLAAKAAEKGIRTLECPVTGGVHLARQGKITVLVGGDQNLFAEHEAALRAIGGKLIHMGPLGSASIIKVITNMLAFIHLVADGEALMLAKQGGLDLGKAWEAIAASSGNSFVHETEGQLILNGSYNIGFTADLALKDLGFAMGFGEEFGVPLELAGIVRKAFERCKDAYGGDCQSPRVVKLLEDMVGTDLRAPGFPDHLE